MIRFLLSVCFLIVALAASGIVASTSASAHAALSSVIVDPVQTVQVRKTVLPAAKTANLDTLPMPGHGQQNDGCAGNGNCCDTYCHPFVLSVASPGCIVRRSLAAFLPLRQERSAGVSQDGQDRPPRPVAA